MLVDVEVGESHPVWLLDTFQECNTHGTCFSFTFEQKDKVKVQAQEDAKRQQQDRDLQAQQEEEERLLRKKVGVRRKMWRATFNKICLAYQVSMCVCRESRRLWRELGKVKLTWRYRRDTLCSRTVVALTAFKHRLIVPVCCPSTLNSELLTFCCRYVYD